MRACMSHDPKIDPYHPIPSSVEPFWSAPSLFSPEIMSQTASGNWLSGCCTSNEKCLVPRLPCKTNVDGSKCHACHAKQRWMSPSGPLPRKVRRRHRWPCRQVPRLPRKVPWRHRRPSAPKRATRASPVPQVPCLPRKTKVDASKCHTCHAKHRETKVDVAKCPTCHAKCRGVTGDQARPSAPPEPAQCHKCHACYAKRRRMPPSDTPATRNEGGCRQVLRLLRKVPWHHRRPSAPPEPAQCHKCHACHAKRRWMPPSATPATRNEGGCRRVPRLPRKVPRRHRRPSAPKCATRAVSATPATQNKGVVCERWCVKDGVCER